MKWLARLYQKSEYITFRLTIFIEETSHHFTRIEKGGDNLRLPIGIEQARRKRVNLESKLRSIDKIETTLKERIKTLERELAIQKFAENLRLREFPILQGEKAVNALQDFVDEVEEREGEELTARQVDALKELANGLIISIKAEMSLIDKRMRTYIS